MSHPGLPWVVAHHDHNGSARVHSFATRLDAEQYAKHWNDRRRDPTFEGEYVVVLDEPEAT